MIFIYENVLNSYLHDNLIICKIFFIKIFDFFFDECYYESVNLLFIFLNMTVRNGFYTLAASLLVAQNSFAAVDFGTDKAGTLKGGGESS